KANNGEGYFVGRTIFDNVKKDMTIWKDEMFAPILSIFRADSLEEAIETTNESKFANGSCLFTIDASHIRTIRGTIDAGMFGVNLGVHATMAFFTFTGEKDLFYGDLHTNCKDGVEFFTKKKMITSRL